jgi:subtilase family serine protease
VSGRSVSGGKVELVLRIRPCGGDGRRARRQADTPETVKVGDHVVFRYSYTNEGLDTIPANTYHVDFYLDGERIAYDHGTHHMKPDFVQSYTLAYHFQATRPGTYTYRYVLDEDGDLSETDETNNTIEGVVVVAEGP